MPLRAAGLRFPHERVFLARTKLAYIHLPNLLTDATRDRSARVFGYVAIWLPDELLVLFLQEGQLVNATALNDEGYRVVAIADAIERVPAAAEFGEICFHESQDEQLACMHFSQVTEPEPWPAELDASDPGALFPYLRAVTFDGMLEVIRDGAINYVIVRDGCVEDAYLVEHDVGGPAERVRRLFRSDPSQRAVSHRGGTVSVSRWPVPPPLPVQASPALIQAYRAVARGLVGHLVSAGNADAATIAEAARRTLVLSYACLEHLSVLSEPCGDPVVSTEALTEAVAAWVSEIIWSASTVTSQTPEALIRETTKDRRHMLQSAGFYDRLPWALA